MFDHTKTLSVEQPQELVKYTRSLLSVSWVIKWDERGRLLRFQTEGVFLNSNVIIALTRLAFNVNFDYSLKMLVRALKEPSAYPSPQDPSWI